MPEATYPAVVTVHAPSGATHACERHARGIQNLFSSMFGMRLATTPAPADAQCDNCLNEPKD